MYLNTSVDLDTNHFENDCRAVLSWCGMSDLEFKTIKKTTVHHKNTTLIDFRNRERAHGRQATVSVACRGRPSRMMVIDSVVLKLNFENVRRRYDWRGCATSWTGQLRARPLQPDASSSSSWFLFFSCSSLLSSTLSPSPIVLFLAPIGINKKGFSPP